MAQQATGPVFYPRLYHLTAYVSILMGEGENCDLFLSAALKLSESQGNVLEYCWLNLSKVCAITGQAEGRTWGRHPPTNWKPQKPASHWASPGMEACCLSPSGLLQENFLGQVTEKQQRCAVFSFGNCWQVKIRCQGLSLH